MEVCLPCRGEACEPGDGGPPGERAVAALQREPLLPKDMTVVNGHLITQTEQRRDEERGLWLLSFGLLTAGAARCGAGRVAASRSPPARGQEHTHPLSRDNQTRLHTRSHLRTVPG